MGLVQAGGQTVGSFVVGKFHPTTPSDQKGDEKKHLFREAQHLFREAQ